MTELGSGEKEQALSHIESITKALDEGWSRKLDDELDQAYKVAEKLGIRRVEIDRIELKLATLEERQEMFTRWINEELDGMTLDDMVQLRDEFGLKG